MTLKIPELSLVLLIGPSGAGKSTFARTHFLASETISSDYCRYLIADDENDQSVTKEAFEVLRFVAAKRLAAGRLTVIDATNVQPEARKPLLALAREYHVIPVAIVLHVPERICADRNRTRPGRDFGAHVLRGQHMQLRNSLRSLEREGFRHVFVLRPEDIEDVQIERQPLWNNKKHEHGPFDIIGDIHGCFEELTHLLTRLGYAVTGESATPPAGRKAIFVGDLVDRGPGVVSVLKLAMNMSAAGHALCVPGNHDVKLLRKLQGRDVHITHGLAETLQQMQTEPAEFKDAVRTFLDGLVSHFVFDAGKLVVAHAGMKEEMQGRGSAKVRDFALYGETTGETDDFGLPVRMNWAANYRGRALVVYGHTPVPEPEWLNNTVNIDTGCVFGGQLSALRYPEREIVSVPALRMYYQPAKPLVVATETLTPQQRHDELLDVSDVIGKRVVNTRLATNITVREENAAAALEIMSRFAANPKWLIYLPPTMSPPETSRREGYLEHPEEAFAYFRHNGVAKVVCERKHMGSRAIVVICRDQDTARRVFGVEGESAGICYTRTGRHFFEDSASEAEFIRQVQDAIGEAGLWEELKTDWMCLDCELMPWSAKAQDLLRRQYAPAGAASRASLPYAVAALESAHHANPEIAPLLARFIDRQELAQRYVEAYRRYCWPVHSLEDYRLAPFHLLASEGAVHMDKDHIWHMQMLGRLPRADQPFLIATPYLEVDLSNRASEAEAIEWWEQMTAAGGEGMVVKPLPFLCRGPKGYVQPAIKCRGREYLRIIYGPEYTLEDNLSRLRQRALGHKRSLASREFALGMEGLERFVRREPLRRVHECVFAVLALESEPVDPRL